LTFDVKLSSYENMPRQKRLEILGAIYNVIACGIERGEIFNDNIDRKEFIKRLAVGSVVDLAK